MPPSLSLTPSNILDSVPVYVWERLCVFVSKGESKLKTCTSIIRYSLMWKEGCAGMRMVKEDLIPDWQY